MSETLSLIVNSSCSRQLGMESGQIEDYQIIASSSRSSELGPAKGRLNNEEEGGAWCPSQSARPGSPIYLEIDLLEDYVISSVLIQGRYGFGNEYSSYLMLKFWRNEYTDFLEYRDENGEVILKGNVNSQDTREIKLTNAIVIGSKLRILPYNVNPGENICLRVELKGCKYKGNFYDLLMRDTGSPDVSQSYLTSSPGPEAGLGTVVTLASLLTLILVIVIVLATLLFHHRHQISLDSGLLRSWAQSLGSLGSTTSSDLNNIVNISGPSNVKRAGFEPVYGNSFGIRGTSDDNTSHSSSQMSISFTEQINDGSAEDCSIDSTEDISRSRNTHITQPHSRSVMTLDSLASPQAHVRTKVQYQLH